MRSPCPTPCERNTPRSAPTWGFLFRRNQPLDPLRWLRGVDKHLEARKAAWEVRQRDRFAGFWESYSSGATLRAERKRQKSAEHGFHEGTGSAGVEMNSKARVARFTGGNRSLPSLGGLLPKYGSNGGLLS